MGLVGVWPAETKPHSGMHWRWQLRPREATTSAPERSPCTCASSGALALTGGGQRPRRGGAPRRPEYWWRLHNAAMYGEERGEGQEERTLTRSLKKAPARPGRSGR